jgi:hypothetical protein
MGLVATRIEMMLKARDDDKIDFGRTLTLGRQKVWVSRRQYRRLENRYAITGVDSGSIDFKNRIYADQFLRDNFDIKKLSVLDYSGYENSDIIHDMNRSIPKIHEQKYDVVIDGGTLEHIFNFPTAISNCMNMVKRGGSIFVFSMANNHCGHGFYQFAPELFFRIFEPANGFQIKSVVLVEHPYPGAELSVRTKCYSVKDPSMLGRRGSISSKSPLGIMVHAVKTEHKKIFQRSPLQSDYSTSWDEENIQTDSHISGTQKDLTKHRILPIIKSLLPFRAKNMITGLNQLYKYSLKNNGDMFAKWPG